MTMTTPTVIATASDSSRKLTICSFAAEASWSPAAMGASLRPAPHAAASSAASQFV